MTDNEAVIERFADRHEDVVVLDAGELSEDLLAFITGELTDEQLDEIDLQRIQDRKDDLASEPITIAAIVGLSTAAMITVGRIIERWLEAKRQERQLELLIRALQISPRAGQVVADLAGKHADVSVVYTLDSARPSAPSQ